MSSIQPMLANTKTLRSSGPRENALLPLSRPYQSPYGGRCFIELLGGIISTALDRVDQAMSHVIIEQLKCDGLQRASGRRDLLQDSYAIAILFHHALQAANLALNAA